MADWPTLRLDDVAEILDSMRRPVNASERQRRVGSVPYYGATGLAGWIDAALFDETLVLLGEDAVDFGNPGATKAYLVTGPSWVNNHAHVLRAKNGHVLPEYLTHALNLVDYTDFASFGTRSKLTQASMKRINVPVPPMSEQRRIVDLVGSLDSQISALTNEVEAARSLHDALSEFMITGPCTTVREIAEYPRGLVGGPFGSSLVTSDYAPHGIPVIRGTNMPKIGRYVGGEFAYVSQEKAASLSSNLAASGDVIFTQRGTLGQVGLVPEGCPMLVVSQSQMRLRVDQRKALPEYVYFAFARPSAVRMMQAQNTATANPHINLGILATQELPVADLADQRRIVEVLLSSLALVEALGRELSVARSARRALLRDLLNAESLIPTSYDAVLAKAV